MVRAADYGFTSTRGCLYWNPRLYATRESQQHRQGRSFNRPSGPAEHTSRNSPHPKLQILTHYQQLLDHSWAALAVDRDLLNESQGIILREHVDAQGVSPPKTDKTPAGEGREYDGTQGDREGGGDTPIGSLGRVSEAQYVTSGTLSEHRRTKRLIATLKANNTNTGKRALLRTMVGRDRGHVAWITT